MRGDPSINAWERVEDCRTPNALEVLTTDSHIPGIGGRYRAQAAGSVVAMQVRIHVE
jgi:hypothetical protein